MGADKAALSCGGESLAQRTATLLEAVTSPAVEVGPGYSNLRAIVEDDPGAGPLSAVAAGATALRQLGWTGAAIVLATDLPLLSAELLSWLAVYPSERAVVPVAGDRPQPLCARYPNWDLDRAVELSQSGKRSMRDLLAVIKPDLIGPEEWVPAAGHAWALFDVDTPDDLRTIGWTRM
jgi:molybdopterin-guanine dinucleotide biosynthesis protein A